MHVQCVFVGFSFASFARRFLVEDPQIIFPLTLQQVSVCASPVSSSLSYLRPPLDGSAAPLRSLVKAMRASLEAESPVTRRQMKVFWYGILIVFIWQFVSRPSLAGRPARHRCEAR